MDLVLKRNEYRADGIFGELVDLSGRNIAMTLEHGYTDGLGGFYPKVPPGQYTCIRGLHQLAGMSQPFETFEITNVPSHSNILFHVGNFNGDSAGCVLLGGAKAIASTGQKMLTNSRRIFEAFMLLQSGVDSFNLTVLG